MLNETRKISSRQVRDTDYEGIRRLLIKTQNACPVGLNWGIRRLEGKRWYDPSPTGDPDWYKNSRLWETAGGELVGWVHQDGMSYPYIEIQPDYRFLEGEMIVWAEEHLAVDGRIHFFVYDYDIHRQRILTERGYQETADGGVIYHLRFGKQPLVEPRLADGYTLRTTNSEDGRDAQQIADILNAAFNRDFHNALEYQQFTRNATCFVQDLDLVAVAEDGRFAAYVGVPYDAYNQQGIFEPVCTHPDHQQKGLAKALMQEGLRRLRARGAINVVVETGDMIPANRLYSGLGFTEMYQGRYWVSG
jgi:mycothiol synthase